MIVLMCSPRGSPHLLRGVVSGVYILVGCEDNVLEFFGNGL